MNFSSDTFYPENSSLEGFIKMSCWTNKTRLYLQHWLTSFLVFLGTARLRRWTCATTWAITWWATSTSNSGRRKMQPRPWRSWTTVGSAEGPSTPSSARLQIFEKLAAVSWISSYNGYPNTGHSVIRNIRLTGSPLTKCHSAMQINVWLLVHLLNSPCLCAALWIEEKLSAIQMPGK